MEQKYFLRKRLKGFHHYESGFTHDILSAAIYTKSEAEELTSKSKDNEMVNCTIYSKGAFSDYFGRVLGNLKAIGLIGNEEQERIKQIKKNDAELKKRDLA